MKTYGVDFVDHKTISNTVVKAAMPIMVGKVYVRVQEIIPKGRTHILEQRLYSKIDQGGLRGAVGDRAPHAVLVQEGTKAHSLRPKKQGHKMVIPVAGHKLVRMTGQHPGARAHPFLTDGAEQSRGEIQAALRDIV
jgi:hypothetical protein